MTIGLTWRRTARRIKRLKVGVLTISPDYSDRPTPAFLALSYFPERDFVPLMEVLATVNRHTGWMEEFQHWQQRHHHGRPADRVVYAGVIGIGCTIGIRKDGADFPPHQRIGVGECRQLVLLGG